MRVGWISSLTIATRCFPIVALIMVAGCAAPVNRLVSYPEATVLFTSPAEVDRLCKLSPGANQQARYLGCYIRGARLAVVPHGSPDTLAHELRHARDGKFHE